MQRSFIDNMSNLRDYKVKCLRIYHYNRNKDVFIYLDLLFEKCLMEIP